MSQYYRQVRQDERPIRYCAQDERRFGLHTLIGRLITAFLQFSHVDTACYQSFLDEFSKAYPDSLNLLQVDNGRFYTGKDLMVPENIILVF